MKIPSHLSVSVRVCYQGKIHRKIASLGEDVNGRSAIYLFDLPRGYAEEHDIQQIDYLFRTKCIVPDVSGESQWVAQEIMDLDAFAGDDSVIE